MPKAKAKPMSWSCFDPSCVDLEPFSSEIDLHEHQYDVHGAPRPKVSYMCRARDCGQRFDVETDRNLHEITDHDAGAAEPMTPGKRDGVGIRPTPSRAASFVCAIGGCEERFDTPQALGIHRKKTHPGWTAADIDQSLVTQGTSSSMAGAVERARAAKGMSVSLIGDDEPIDFICGVLWRGVVCMEVRHTPQGRGAHRRHEHPGWTKADVDPSALALDDPERQSEQAVAGDDTDGDSGTTKLGAPEPSLSGSAPVPATSDVEVPDQALPGDDSVGELNTTAQEPPPNVADPAEWPASIGETLPTFPGEIEQRSFYLPDEIPLRKGDEHMLAALAFLEMVSVEVLIARAVRAFLAPFDDNGRVKIVAEVHRVWAEGS